MSTNAERDKRFKVRAVAGDTPPVPCGQKMSSAGGGNSQNTFDDVRRLLLLMLLMLPAAGLLLLTLLLPPSVDATAALSSLSSSIKTADADAAPLFSIEPLLAESATAAFVAVAEGGTPVIQCLSQEVGTSTKSLAELLTGTQGGN
jgi:hypothetical protein